VIETIAQEIRQLAPNADVRVAPSEPIVGAALLGLDALAADASATARGRAELDAAVARLGETPGSARLQANSGSR
jgi:hypothetical protein